jgi:hypothetical protein
MSVRGLPSVLDRRHVESFSRALDVPECDLDTGQCRPVSRQHPEVSAGIFLLYDAEEDRPITFHDVCALRDRRSSLAAQPESVLQSAARNTGDDQRVSLVMGVHDDAVEVGFVAQYLEAGESAPLVADEECLDEIAWANALRSTVLFPDRLSLFEREIRREILTRAKLQTAAKAQSSFSFGSNFGVMRRR